MWGNFWVCCKQSADESVEYNSETSASQQVMEWVWGREVSDRDNNYLRKQIFKLTVILFEVFACSLCVC